MTKNEVIKALRDKAGLETKDKAAAAYESLVEILLASLHKEGEARLCGLGKFKLHERKARKGRNPRTGKEINIAAARVVKFFPAKGVNESF